MMSLRRTALVWMTALLAVVGIAAVLIAYGLARHEAGGFLDSQLRQIALNAGEGLPDSAGPQVDHDPEDEFSLTIWDAQGHKIHTSPPEIDIPRQTRIGFADIQALDDRWRVYTSSDGLRTVQVAQRSSVREELAASAAIEAATPILIVMPLSWIVLGWAMDRLLRRLDSLARDIATRSTSTVEPIPLAGVPSEVASLVDALNNLISRQHDALDQQKRFLSDAAHELRTPLAALQIQIEGLASGPAETLPERQAVLAQGIRRTTDLVNQLLRLARVGDVAGSTVMQRVDVLPLLLASVADHVGLAERGGVDIGMGRHDAVQLSASAADLQLLFDNLVGNGVRYTPPGGTVDVSLQLEDDHAVVDIVDTGPGIPLGAESRIFDRFFRAAPGDIEGTGLGLSIVRSIAERHGFEVSVTNRTDGRSGVRARVVMPDAIMDLGKGHLIADTSAVRAA
jgi:two-component system OmpR family sensor kinase